MICTLVYVHYDLTTKDRSISENQARHATSDATKYLDTATKIKGFIRLPYERILYSIWSIIS